MKTLFIAHTKNAGQQSRTATITRLLEEHHRVDRLEVDPGKSFPAGEKAKPGSSHFGPKHYATGTVAFIEEADIISEENIDRLPFMDYGSIIIEKKVLEEIGGYNEGFEIWGGEDDNIRRRLDMIGAKQLKMPKVKSLHREEKLSLEGRFVKTYSFRAKEWERFFYPKAETVNRDNWGEEFNKVIYD